jgi:hypothetical protein
MGNRLNNMTTDERRKASRPSENYIISQCCSVDDLRCSLNTLQPVTFGKMDEALADLKGAADYEQSKETPRVTIIKMLEAKINAINKKRAL